MLADEILTYNSEVEAPLGKVGRVGLFGSIQSMTLSQDCLHQQSEFILLAYCIIRKRTMSCLNHYTFPPKTSSPMIKQAAVEIVRELRSSADIGAILAKANRLVLYATGVERCLVI
jgi:hypothetical protein